MNKDEIIDFEQLYESGTKCMRSVGWKPTMKSFLLNQFERTLSMETRLKTGTWKNGKPRPIKIYFPKEREGLSIQTNDRVYQRSINDNELYPKCTRAFILDNCACQIGKGPDFARDRLKRDLHNFVMKYGLDDAVITQFDIHGYYASMVHQIVNEMFGEYVPPDIQKMVVDVLNKQYVGDVGYSPGSQMVQITGITLLNHIDHMCKEELHMRYYRRYMDDGLDIGSDREKAEANLGRVISELEKLGFTMNPKKTHVTPLKKGFTFLGFRWRVTESAKVIMTIDTNNVKHERKKLRRMVHKARRGEMDRKKVDECYRSWKTYASKGNSYKLLKRMDAYYKSLWEEEI